MIPQSTLTPTVKADRINAIDTLRGVSVCGILLMNIAGFGLYMSYEDITINGGATGWNRHVWWINSVFFEGTMRGMFSVLFGAGILLFTNRSGDTRSGNIVDLFFRRLVWLILFGIIHCYLLLWTGEILYTYGLIGMIAFSFRHLSPRKLIIGAVIFLSLATLWNVSDYFNTRDKYEKAATAGDKKSHGNTLTEEETAAISTWDETLKERKPGKEKMDKEIAEMHKGYFSIVMHTVPAHQYMQTMFVYRLGAFDTLAMMLLGMAFLKLGVLQASRSYRYYLLMALIGYTIGITVNYFETTHILKNQFSVLSFDESSMTYHVGRVANMCGHIALIMLFIKSAWLPFLQRSLAAVGQMALTNYISQSLICNFIFLGYGLAKFGELQRYQLYYVVFGIWIFQLIVSTIWLRYFRFGPMEWVWRSLTYWKKQPFVRETLTETRLRETAGVR
ncbi:MAG TPA: DUF418 domain-containing protein [Chryseolinea sp.]|nr:DUF418 domain-containing protein [Chryseolinea sp.]